MAGWLTRATAAFRGTPEAAPEMFRIACECGGEVTGLRTATHQKMNCLGCQRPILVLPASPYPVVKRIAQEPPPKQAKTVVQPEERSSPVKSAKVSRRSRKPASPPGLTEKKLDDKPAPVAAETVERLDLSPALQQEKLRRRTIRLVVAAIVALVAVTGWSLRNRSLREQARLQIPISTEQGLAALRDGDFLTASRELTLAVQGLDALGRADAAAQSIRQSRREAVAAAGLSTVGLADLANEFLSDAAPDRQRRFQSQSGTTWLVFDASWIRKLSATETLFELDVPLAVGERMLQVQCDFPELRRFAADASTQAPLRAVLAGQIEEWIVPAAPAQPVIARLRSSTAFLWSDYESLQAIGDRADSADAERETRELLSRQRQECRPLESR